MKLKKSKEKEEKALHDKQIYDQEMQKALKKGEKFISETGKVVKKKTAPSKKVDDENGSEWEIVDESKT